MLIQPYIIKEFPCVVHKVEFDPLFVVDIVPREEDYGTFSCFDHVVSHLEAPFSIWKDIGAVILVELREFLFEIF